MKICRKNFNKEKSVMYIQTNRFGLRIIRIISAAARAAIPGDALYSLKSTICWNFPVRT
ncbi:MAG TPA: hypothetical protein VIV15_03430 [Anaerolineales bacterium]